MTSATIKTCTLVNNSTEEERERRMKSKVKSRRFLILILHMVGLYYALFIKLNTKTTNNMSEFVVTHGILDLGFSDYLGQEFNYLTRKMKTFIARLLVCVIAVIAPLLVNIALIYKLFKTDEIKTSKYDYLYFLNVIVYILGTLAWLSIYKKSNNNPNKIKLFASLYWLGLFSVFFWPLPLILNKSRSLDSEYIYADFLAFWFFSASVTFMPAWMLKAFGLSVLYIYFIVRALFIALGDPSVGVVDKKMKKFGTTTKKETEQVANDAANETSKVANDAANETSKVANDAPNEISKLANNAYALTISIVIYVGVFAVGIAIGNKIIPKSAPNKIIPKSAPNRPDSDSESMWT